MENNLFAAFWELPLGSHASKNEGCPHLCLIATETLRTAAHPTSPLNSPVPSSFFSFLRSELLHTALLRARCV